MMERFFRAAMPPFLAALSFPFRIADIKKAGLKNRLGRPKACSTLAQPPKSEKGAEVVEFALMLLPIFALIFLIVNVAWVIFARACIQEAVRAGVRYAITGPASNSDVQSYVQEHSFGMIPSASSVCVQYFSPTNLSTPLASTVAVTGGDVVQISIANVNVRPLAPLLISSAALPLSASASDIMQTPTPPTVIYPVQCQ